MSDETDNIDSIDGIDCPHGGHEGHEHIDPEIVSQILHAVTTALPINNLFVVFAPNPSRFILTNIDEDGSLRVIGYIPFDFTLELSMGLVRAVQRVISDHVDRAALPADVTPDDITPVGPFKVI